MGREAGLGLARAPPSMRTVWEVGITRESLMNATRTILALLSLAFLVILAACNTTRGAGEDLEHAGQHIQNSAERHGAD